MILYPFFDIPVLLLSLLFTFATGFILGGYERKVRRRDSYRQGYTDCLNELKQAEKEEQP